MTSNPRDIYISGQITGLEEPEYSDIFARGEAFVLDMGYNPVSPLKVVACEGEDCTGTTIRFSDGRYMHSWTCYIKHDLKALLECDAIAMLPNWQNSRGAKLEREVAVSSGLAIFYFSHDMKELA